MKKLFCAALTCVLLSGCFGTNSLYTYSEETDTHKVQVPSQYIEDALGVEPGGLKEVDLSGKSFYTDDTRFYIIELKGIETVNFDDNVTSG